MTHDDLLALLREERRQDRALAAQFVRACCDGSVGDLQEATSGLFDASVSGWTIAFRTIARKKFSVTPEVQRAFFSIWVESKSIRLRVEDDLVLISALRLLLPPYRGGALRLFRGAGANERRRRRYGLSWTISIDVAERFAQQWRSSDGSVLLETFAPAEAIIAAVDYPEPFTPSEIEEIRRDHPGAIINEFHEEREYLIDRRRLMGVKVVRRYPAI